MSSMPNVTIIGAGSVEFTIDVLSNILSFEDLADVSVVLHDIDEARLETAGRIGARINEAKGRRATIETQSDRRKALDGADYAINEIQVGGRDAFLIDFAIPSRYGVRQTIADTLGIGGISRGLRTLPVMIDIAQRHGRRVPRRDAAELHEPDGDGAVGRLRGLAVRSRGRPLPLGLLHARVPGRDGRRADGRDRVPDVGLQPPGVRHAVRARRRGSLSGASTPRSRRTPRGSAVASGCSSTRSSGYFPTESSEHSAEYVSWFMRHDDQIERFRIPVDDYIGRTEEALADYREIVRKLEAGEPVAAEPGSELASDIIHSIETGMPRALYANVKNTGLIPDLPDGCCVEVPCLVDRAGVQPTAVPARPAHLTAMNRTFLNVVEFTVRAVIDGDRQQVYRAAMLDPNVAATLTLDQVHDMVDELIDAHGDMIPEAIRGGSKRRRS